ncbi:SRPBCC family protein [Duganella sp. FT92W]|uniref:SRPBCC family protein n=1 Tax=Pseudoduganella rivuli TaxID=2666085 RepID=A0A7X2IT86_9BURK|nr:SRPBCC family protein [Pseudoduganella rivuli]MRV75666.1 SRPBCC family protein [Pseudoduganella rivuli]
MLQKTAQLTAAPDTLVRNPCTPVLSGSTELPVAARQAWAVVGDFSGFSKFITGLERTEMTGEGIRSVRKKFFADGNVVLEQLNSHDDARMVMTWSLLYTTFNIGNLWAAMRVEELGASRCKVTWDIVGEPWTGGPEAQPAFNAFVAGFLEMAMSNLRTVFQQ